MWHNYVAIIIHTDLYKCVHMYCMYACLHTYIYTYLCMYANIHQSMYVYVLLVQDIPGCKIMQLRENDSYIMYVTLT